MSIPVGEIDSMPIRKAAYFPVCPFHYMALARSNPAVDLEILDPRRAQGRSFHLNKSDVLQQPRDRLVVGEAMLSSISGVSIDDFHFLRNEEPATSSTFVEEEQFDQAGLSDRVDRRVPVSSATTARLIPPAGERRGSRLWA
jgi:hypothetical protein